MFYRAAYDEEQSQHIEMSKREQYNWLAERLRDPQIPINTKLEPNDQQKFKLVCSLRLAQRIKK